MRQENRMELKDGHIVVMPPVYEISLNKWRWCKIGEVCAVASGLGKITGSTRTFTPEQLIQNFAILARPNKFQIHERAPKKIFRFSLDGKGLRGVELPTQEPRPPYVELDLGIDTPYPPELFVPEGWALDTLKAIRRGAHAAAQWGEVYVGFTDKEEAGTVFTLQAVER
jgi:hypothetical protein